MTSVVFTFGRFQPPTIGHQKMVDEIIKVARKTKSHAQVFLSHSQDNKKNPIPYIEKLVYATAAFGNIVRKSKAKTIIEVMKELEGQGYESVVMVAGSDRVKDFDTLLNKYNGKEYNFSSIEVVSAGTRDPDAEGSTGMSGTKLRQLAKDGDFNKFKAGIAKKIDDKKKKEIFDILKEDFEDDWDPILEEITEDDIDEEIRELMGLPENQLDEVPMTIQQRLKRGRQMKRLSKRIARARKIKSKRMATKDTLEVRAKKAARNILRKKFAGKRGEDYSKLAAGQKIQIDKLLANKAAIIPKLAKRLMPKIKKAEIERLKSVRSARKESFDLDFELWLNEREDKDIGDREGSQPAKYHSGLKKSTKVARDQQFKRQTKMDDDDPSAYKPAPGDKEAKTKPSKYTLKYKKVFGEAKIEGLEKKAEKSGISYSVLKKVYDRGMAAWKTGHRPGTTPQQWAFARVNSFITGGKTRTTTDADLWKLASKSKKEGMTSFKSYLKDK